LAPPALLQGDQVNAKDEVYAVLSLDKGQSAVQIARVTGLPLDETKRQIGALLNEKLCKIIDYDALFTHYFKVAKPHGQIKG
jgi:hypothetical protein